jgi:hypothetical protein
MLAVGNRARFAVLALTSALMASASAPAQPLGPQLRDPQGVKACLALNDAFKIFLHSGYFPGLRERMSEAAGIAATSNDPCLRNAASNLASAKTTDELITWLKVTTGVCVNRSLTNVADHSLPSAAGADL